MCYSYALVLGVQMHYMFHLAELIVESWDSQSMHIHVASNGGCIINLTLLALYTFNFFFYVAMSQM